MTTTETPPRRPNTARRTGLILVTLLAFGCGTPEQENDTTDPNNTTTQNNTTDTNNTTGENNTTDTTDPPDMMTGDPDADNDGIPDADDACPMEPEDIDGVEDDDGCPDVEAMGDARITFKPTFGSNFPNQLPASWRAPLNIPTSTADSPVVVLLCETADAGCTDPVMAVEVATDAPVQGSFGPDLEVGELPAGEYDVMVFLDSTRSRERGWGWQETPAKTLEQEWGGHVSEFDIMLSAPDASPSDGNPEPAPVRVTLVDGEAVDLGTLRMGHFHVRRVDPEPVSEQGAMAVVTENGLRMIELSSFEVADAGGGFRDYFLVDDQGNDLSDAGSICGMVEGPGDVIYVLYDGGTGAGFAAPFDVRTRQQLGGGAVVIFPGSGSPCQGIYHEVGGREYLYAINIGASGLASGDKGMWYAEVTGGVTANVAGSFLQRADDDLYEVGFNAIAAHDGTLYATMTPENSDSAFVPDGTVGFHTVFKGQIEDGGRPNFQAGGDYDFWTPMPTRDGVTRPDGNVDCVTSLQSGGTTAGLYVAPFHDGRDLLFVGGCSRIAVFDLGADARVDADPGNPRSQDIDATLFGHAFTRFTVSPDGDVLYVLPQFKSQFHFYFARDNDPSSRQTFNRYMILPLALDQGDAPALHPDFAGEDVDGHEGATNIGDKVTPAADPGIDINMGHMTRYQVNWAGSLAGSTNQSGSIPTGPSIAAGLETIWLRGSGISGNSGLGKGANLMAYSVSERRAHLWAHNQNGTDWGFHHYWLAGNESDEPFGYDLTPESNAYLATYGLLYVDLR